MKFRNLSLVTVIGGLALVACAKDQTSTPLAPTSVARAVTPSAPSCNFTTTRSDAALYFSASSLQSVREAISNMEVVYNASGAAAANNKGFDVLTKVSSALSTAGAVGGSPTAGDTFVKDVLACMSVGTLPAGFSVAGALSPNGLFEVVGGAGDPTGPVTSRGTPTYGAEPQAGQSWAGSAGGLRYLLYGNERDFSFTPETPAAVTAFELATIPTPITFAPAIVGGICQTTATNALIQSVSTILPLQSLSFCSGISSIRRQDRGVFASITHSVASMFSPAPVYGFGVGGTGSLLSGLSPKAAVTFAPTAAGLAFVQQPKDSRRSLRPQFSPAVSVLVTTAAGTPVNGVLVTLTVYNNNGSYTLSNATATSGVGAGPGIAVFPTLYTDKAGGYNFVASASIFGQATKSALSTRINIDGK
jgi:hypothetical protein